MTIKVFEQFNDDEPTTKIFINCDEIVSVGESVYMIEPVYLQEEYTKQDMTVITLKSGEEIEVNGHYLKNFPGLHEKCLHRWSFG